MKKMIIAGLAILLSQVSIAQTLLPVKIVSVTNTIYQGGYADKVYGKELNAFKVPDDANFVKMSVEVRIKDYKPYATKLLNLLVTNTKTNETLFTTYWYRLFSDTTLRVVGQFPPGEYYIRLIENKDEKNIIAKRTINVEGKIAKANGGREIVRYNGYDYDVNKFKIWVCKDVDEVNWKPIGVTTKINTGGCIIFFFESPEKIKNPGTLRWKLYRVGPDGKEVFVNQRDQTPKMEEFRRIYYEECGEFNTAGKYKIYLEIRNESEAYYGVLNSNYFASGEINVQ